MTQKRRRKWSAAQKLRIVIETLQSDTKLAEVCEEVSFKGRYVLHSLRKYWASTMAQQGIPPIVLTKMFGHTDVKLIMRVYYAQNDDEQLVAKASKIDFGSGLPKVG